MHLEREILPPLSGLATVGEVIHGRRSGARSAHGNRYWRAFSASRGLPGFALLLCRPVASHWRAFSASLGLTGFAHLPGLMDCLACVRLPLWIGFEFDRLVSALAKLLG